MKDKEKTREQLLEELALTRKRIAKLEEVESERRQVEDRLRKSEEEYRNIFENAIEGTYRVSPDGSRFLTANPVAARVLGYESADDLINAITDIPTQIYAYPEDRHEALRLMNEQGFIKDFQIRCRHKEGRIIWCSFNARIVRDDTGQVLYHEGTNRDINDRKQAEEALRKAEQQLKLILDTVPALIWQKDREGKYLQVNKACCDTVGLPGETILGKTDYDLFPAEIADRYVGADLKILNSETPELGIEEQHLKSSGEPGWSRTDKMLHYDTDGEVAGTIGFAIDITERKEKDIALRESEAKYRRIVDMANEGIWSLDGDFVTTFVNRRMTCMLGYDESEMVGRPVRWFMFEEDLADLQEKMGNRRTGINDRYERRYRHKDGRTVWVILSVTPLFDDTDGSFKGSFAMVTDITERKHMEEELLRSRHDLELRVRERTAELERVNGQLRSIPSKLIAVQEDERKRIAGELHDSVGQTLAALKYGIETVLVKKDTGDLAGAFELLERFVPTLQQSIEETRSIYMGLRPSMLDSLGLLATLEWFCREFQKLHSKLALDVKTRIKEKEIPDLLKITVFRIVQEALNNIAKHSRAKRVKLFFLKKQDSIELLVQDDGTGFDLESTFKNNPKTLGLPGMRERVEITCGTFSVESAPDKGTTIRAFWPR